MATLVTRPAADEYAPYYAGYVAGVPESNLLTILSHQIEETLRLLDGLPPERARHRYAPGKWSVTEVAGHLADVERVFAYRALRIARGDATPLPGFDENAYVGAGGFDRRPLEDVLAELQAVRGATVALFRGFEPEALVRRGVANGTPVSVRALGYIIAGHERHHLEVLRTRYSLGG